MFVGQAVFLAALALSKCSTLSFSLVRSPKAVAGQEHRLALHLTRTRKRRRHTCCLHCAAVALGVSSRSMCEADDDAAPTEDVVLSGWLQQSRHEGRVEVISSFEEKQGARDSSPPHRFQELIQVGMCI